MKKWMLILLLAAVPVQAGSISDMDQGAQSQLTNLGTELLRIASLRDNFEFTFAKIRFGGPKYAPTPGPIPLPGMKHLFKKGKHWGPGEWTTLGVGALTVVAVSLADQQAQTN